MGLNQHQLLFLNNWTPSAYAFTTSDKWWSWLVPTDHWGMHRSARHLPLQLSHGRRAIGTVAFRKKHQKKTTNCLNSQERWGFSKVHVPASSELTSIKCDGIIPRLMDRKARRTVPAAFRHAADGQLDFDIVPCWQGTKEAVYSTEHISKHI